MSTLIFLLLMMSFVNPMRINPHKNRDAGKIRNILMMNTCIHSLSRSLNNTAHIVDTNQQYDLSLIESRLNITTLPKSTRVSPIPITRCFGRNMKLQPIISGFNNLVNRLNTLILNEIDRNIRLEAIIHRIDDSIM